jgi:hypothetical protein
MYMTPPPNNAERCVPYAGMVLPPSLSLEERVHEKAMGRKTSKGQTLKRQNVERYKTAKLRDFKREQWTTSQLFETLLIASTEQHREMYLLRWQNTNIKVEQRYKDKAMGRRTSEAPALKR